MDEKVKKSVTIDKDIHERIMRDVEKGEASDYSSRLRVLLRLGYQKENEINASCKPY